MARYEITGPDGKRYEVTAPDGASEDDVLSFFKGQISKHEPAGPPMPPEQPLTAGETAADVVKSAGIGVVQGGIGLATLPGNLEALGRAGIDAGARTLGIADPGLSQSTFLPTYSDVKGKVEEYTGEFYEPKSTLGQYARTVGEFAPMGVGAGLSAGARAARVLVPAVVSETAGQATAGTEYEPWARVAGAMVGAKLPAAGAPPRAARDPEVARAVNTLEGEGVTALTAAQRTGNRPMRWVEDASGTVPFAGQRASQMAEEAGDQFTRAALRQAGVNADRATADVLNQAFNNFGQEYRQFFGPRTLIAGQGTQRRLANIVRDYQSSTPQAQQIGLVTGLAQDIAQRGMMSGADYLRFRSQLRSAQRQYRENPVASRAIDDMVGTLDTAFVRSQPRGQSQQQALAQLRDMNTRYRNLLAIEDATKAAGEGAAVGIVSPAALARALKKQNSRDYTRGRSNIANLARSGEAVMRPLRSSGTAERTQALSYFDMPGAAIGGVAMGDVSGLLFGLARPAARAAAARAVMSRPGQAAIRNQPAIPNLRAGDAPSNTFLATSAGQFEKAQSGLRGGSGPMYDEEERKRRLLEMMEAE